MSQDKGPKDSKLDKEEQRIEKTLERGEFVSVPDLKEAKRFFEEEKAYVDGKTKEMD